MLWRITFNYHPVWECTREARGRARQHKGCSNVGPGTRGGRGGSQAGRSTVVVLVDAQSQQRGQTLARTGAGDGWARIARGASDGTGRGRIPGVGTGRSRPGQGGLRGGAWAPRARGK